MSSPARPRTLALFQKRIEGDDALLRLAGLRFRQDGLGTELYAGTPDELESLWPFRPFPEDPAVVHLNRSIDLLDEQSHQRIAEVAGRFGGRLYGMVVHDQSEMASQPGAYLNAVRKAALRLDHIQGSPWLFIEYAAGLEPTRFVEFFMACRELERVSACLDVGHVGIRQVQNFYSRIHPGEQVCSLAPDDPRIPRLAGDIQDAVHSSLPVVLALIQALGDFRKPVHFHLHDGHPLSKLSRYGVSDHSSFLTRIPVPFEYDHKWSLDPMYGPAGLLRIVREAMAVMNPDSVSFTLEIHPGEGSTPLEDAAWLFEHWHDKANAERMNYWLSVLGENHRLLLAALA